MRAGENVSEFEQLRLEHSQSTSWKVKQIGHLYNLESYSNIKVYADMFIADYLIKY